MSSMTIRECRTHHLSIPLPQQRISGIHAFTHLETILLEMDVGDAVGIGYAFAFEPWQARSIRMMVADLTLQLIGKPVGDPRDAWRGLWSRINYIGQAGPPVMALSMVDTALWDLGARAAGMPLFRMLGAERVSVPVYASGGWLSYSKEELVEEAQWARDRGFKHYKMKVGQSEWRSDIDRVGHVVGAVTEIEILVDANQAWDADTAIEAGKALEELGVYWIEEPVDVNDISGSARVADALEVPVASGESVFTRYGFRPLIDLRAADVLMPDVMRCGGPSEFLEVVAMAQAAGRVISSHLFTEISGHLVAASPIGTLVEYIPGWFDNLFEDAPRVVGGSLTLAELPGLGFTFSEQAMKDHAVDDVFTL